MANRVETYIEVGLVQCVRFKEENNSEHRVFAYIFLNKAQANGNRSLRFEKDCGKILVKIEINDSPIEDGRETLTRASSIGPKFYSDVGLAFDRGRTRGDEREVAGEFET